MDAAVGQDVALLEQPLFACRPDSPFPIDCFTRLATYDPVTLALRSRLSLPPVTVGTGRFAQVGQSVFTRRGGERRLLSRLRGAEAAEATRLSVLP